MKSNEIFFILFVPSFCMIAKKLMDFHRLTSNRNGFKVLRMSGLDESFFQRVLRRGLHDETITGVTIKDERPAVGKGDNLLSVVSRFTLEYHCNETDDELGNLIKKEIKLIVKCEPTEMSPGTELIIEQNIFSTELNIFNIILPETERLLARRLSPTFFYGSKNPGVIVLEDLAVLGFKTKDRQRGLPMDHILMALESIAKFHAGSVYQFERNPNVVKSFTDGIMTKNTPKNMFRVLEQTLQMVCEKSRNWPGSRYSRIADKLVVMKQKFAEEVLRVTDYDETEFCVLNHGDYWINNIMFREDANGKPLEVVLIDYQMSVYSSPAIDLIYFLSVCPEVDVHTSKNDFFIEKYLQVLTKSMKLLRCKTKPPSFEDLEKAMLKRRMHAIMAGITFHPRMLADASEIETFDEILSTGVTNMNIFKNPTATIILQRVLPIMDEKGYFD